MPNDILLTCVGDLMLELIDTHDNEQRVQRTWIIDHARAAVGGSAVNLCWNLSELGRKSTMVAAYGVSERDRVRRSLGELNIQIESLVEHQSTTDLLVVLPGPGMPAAYVRGYLDDSALAALLSRMNGSEILLFGGSRHERFRKIILQTITSRRQMKLIFSPSYSIYDLEIGEVREFLQICDIAAFNEHEAAYLVSQLSLPDMKDLMRLPNEGCIITAGENGAQLFHRGNVLHAPSVSNRKGDVIGSGDAFLAGFVDEYLTNGDWERAGRQASVVAAQVVRMGQVRTRLDRRLISEAMGSA